MKKILLLSIIAVFFLAVAPGLAAGKFGGVGLTIAQLFDPKAPGQIGELVVLDAIAGAPGEKGGVQRGDVILQIEGQGTRGQAFDSLVARLRGPVGTRVQVAIRRAGRDGVMIKTIQRAEITAPKPMGK